MSAHKLAGGSQGKEHTVAEALKNVIGVIGIDIGQNTSHVVGLDGRGAVALRQKWSRGQIETRLATLPPCPIGMEVCVGAHHLSRRLRLLGHDPRLIPAKYVRPYSKGHGLVALAIAGIAMEVGIEPTVRHAADLGIIPVVVADACGAGDAAAARRSLESLRFAGDAIITNAQDYCQALTAGKGNP
jgi:hypothetical protein